MQPQATVLHFIAQESQNVCVLGTLKGRLTYGYPALSYQKKKSACEVTSGFCGGLISSSRQDAALITT